MSATDAVLGIDGALGAFSVALHSRSGAFAPRALAGAGHDALERGLALLARVLEGLPPAALERIVVTTGPGSFTGLRIAVAYAKSLAFATGVPLAGIGSFEVLAPDEGEPPGFALAVIPSRAGRANVRLHRPDGGSDDFAGSFAEIASRVAGTVARGFPLPVRGVAAGVIEALGERDVHVISVPLSTPIALAVAALGSSRRPLVNPHALVANYGDGPATADPEVHVPDSA